MTQSPRSSTPAAAAGQARGINPPPRSAVGYGLGLVVVALVGLVAVGLAASPAGAHDGEAVFAVEASEPQDDGSVHYVVRVTWSDDGHPAADATVTAVPVDAAGAAQTAVPMSAVDQDGRYEATVTFPSVGAWTIRFAAINPDGTHEQAQEVAEPATTTTAAATTTAADSGETTTSAATDDTEAASSTESSDDDNSSAGPMVGVLIALGVLAFVGYLVWRSRRGGGPSGSSPTPSDEATTPAESG